MLISTEGNGLVVVGAYGVHANFPIEFFSRFPTGRPHGPCTPGHAERLAANLLKIARAKTGKSQRELAEAARVAQSTIARIESGFRQPSLPVLARILAAIDLEMRIMLEAYDNHDNVLDAEHARLSSDQRAARRAAQDR